MNTTDRSSRWISRSARAAEYLRTGVRCVYCGTTLRGRRDGLDHVQPRALGGSHALVVAACERCNGAKGSRAPSPVELAIAASARARPIDLSGAAALAELYPTGELARQLAPANDR